MNTDIHHTLDNHHSFKQIQRLSYILDKVREKTHTYQAAAATNSKLYMRLFIFATVVSVLKDVVGTILSNNIVSTDIQQYTLLASSLVGFIISAINVISSAFEYQVKYVQFTEAAEQFNMLENRIRFEIINPNEDFNQFCTQLETDIDTIKSQCKFQPSLAIKEKYRHHSNRHLMLPNPHHTPIHVNTPHINPTSNTVVNSLDELYSLIPTQHYHNVPDDNSHNDNITTYQTYGSINNTHHQHNTSDTSAIHDEYTPPLNQPYDEDLGWI